MAQQTLPNYHFLLLSPNLGAEWLFDAGRRYWQRFMPIIIPSLEFVTFIPEEQRTAVTVIARRDTITEIGVQIAQAAPRAVFDPVVYDTLQEAKNELNRRADFNEPFGVPLLPTTEPGQLIDPTPGALFGGQVAPTRPAGGFVTQTPTPTTTPSAPIEPTPGSILGG